MPQGLEQPSQPPSLDQQIELLGLGSYEQAPSGVPGEVQQLTPEQVGAGINLPSGTGLIGPNGIIVPPPEVENAPLADIEPEAPSPTDYTGAPYVSPAELAPPPGEGRAPTAQEIYESSGSPYSILPSMTPEQAQERARQLAEQPAPPAEQQQAPPTEGERPETEKEKPPEEAPPEEAPPEEGEKAPTEIDLGKAGPKPPGPAPEVKTVAQRANEAFEKGRARMTAEQRAEAGKYEQYLTDKLKQDLVTGKIGIYEFMARAGGNQQSAQTIKDALEGRSTLANIFGGSQLQQGRDAVRGLQQVIADYQKGAASDHALTQAYDKAMTQFTSDRTQYELGLYQSYQNAQQQQQQQQQQPVITTTPDQPYDQPLGPLDYRPDYVSTSLPAMTITSPLDTRPSTAPGGIIPFGPDPRVDYYSVPSTAAPPAAPPAAAPPAAPSPEAPRGPSTAPSERTPSAPSTGGVDPGQGTGTAGGAGYIGGVGEYPAPIDLSYFGGGVPSPAMQMAQTGAQMLSSVAQAKSRYPNEIAQIAAAYGVDIDTAATIFMAQHGQIASRQFGGPLYAGQPSLVGESGPEMFVPNQPGTVVPLPRQDPRPYSDYMRYSENYRQQPRATVTIPQVQNLPGSLAPMLPIPSDEAIRYWTNPAFRTHALPTDLEFWQQTPYVPIPDLVDEGTLRFHPEAWNEWLLRQPRSKRVEDRRLEPTPIIQEGDPVATNQPNYRRR
jgi:hypothetical protein